MAPIPIGVRNPPQSSLSQLPQVSIMKTESQQPKDWKSAVSLLNAAVEAVNLAKEISSIAPANAAFGTVSVLLTMLKDPTTNGLDLIELGLYCADICGALDRGLNGKELSDLSQSVCDAINQLTMTVAEIQRKAIKCSKRNAVSRLLHAKYDKEMIVAWKLDLTRILRVFNIELAINTHEIISDVHHGVVNTHVMGSEMHHNMLQSQYQPTQISIFGELLPQPPRGFFGRDDLVDKIVNLVKNLTSVALIGTGGIGKTSIALAVLHSDPIKQQFGNNRRFICCNQFPPSSNHFLSRLSKAIGANVENPEDLTPLQPYLSSKEMLIVIDNAESVLDLQEIGNQKIYTLVEELSQFRNICLCITSCVSTIPPGCEILDVPTLSMEAAQKAFHHIYKHGEQSNLTNNILEQLNFHPLSVALLATVAECNRWDPNQLAQEWERQRTGMFYVQNNRSLAATIKLFLASPVFQELGPNAHALLEVVAFFPQGINGNNLDWLFPTISNRTNILNNFCIFSLTYWSNGFITMLAPLRDYFCPKDPMSAPLLCSTKEHYFSQLSVEVDPDMPGFHEAKWVRSEDINIEHLLNVFTTIDAASDDVWVACINFMEHLYWHKQRPIMLGPKIEGLLDNHPSKPQCLFELSRLLNSIGNYVGESQLLIQALELWRERGNQFQVAHILRTLCQTSRNLELYAEGIQQAKEALEMYKQLNNNTGQAACSNDLAYLLYDDNQLDAAEEAAQQSISLLPNRDDEYVFSKACHLLGNIYCSRGETEKAIEQHEAALWIESSSDWHSWQFGMYYSLAEECYNQRRFNDAHTRLEYAKSHIITPIYLGYIMWLQAKVLFQQDGFEEAKSEALGAVDVFEKLGASKKAEACRQFLKRIEEQMNAQDAKGSGKLTKWFKHILL